MKPTIVLLVLLANISFPGRGNADVRSAIINWLGDGGYRARITMSYDDSFAFVSAWGGTPFGGTPTNQGISSLSVAFYLPSSRGFPFPPAYSTQDISNSIPTYKFLNIGFDTVSRNLVGPLDVGRDSFAEGDPGSSAGQY